MDLQTSIYGCGSAALANALAALGYTVPQDLVGELADTAGSGTGARGLKLATRRLGAVVNVIDESTHQAAWDRVFGAAALGAPSVLLWRGMPS